MGCSSTVKSFSLNYIQSLCCNTQSLLGEPQLQLLSPTQALGDLSHVLSSISTAIPFWANGCSAASRDAGEKKTQHIIGGKKSDNWIKAITVQKTDRNKIPPRVHSLQGCIV